MIDRALMSVLVFLFVTSVGLYVYGHLATDERDKAYIKINELNSKITEQNNAINQLVLAQEQKNIAIKKALEDAQKLRIEYDKAAKEVLAQKVPKKCDEAVRWGAAQGRAIYECWAVGC